MDLGIRDKIALVGGASRGLGKASIMQLAKEGCHILAYARNIHMLENTAMQVRSIGASIETFALDIAKKTDRITLEKLIEKRAPHIVVNVPGGPPPTSAHAIDTALWTTHTEVLLFATISICDSAVVQMRKHQWGRIITITSSGVIEPIPTLAISNTLRAGFTAWSKTLASQVAKDGITVNTITPGRIDTERINELDRVRAQRENITIEAARSQSAQTIPAKRYGKPQEFAAAVAFLASAPAGYITGSQIRVDGGMIRSI